MDPNPVIDISSDEDDVCGERYGRVSVDWIPPGAAVKRAVEDYDDVVVIGEVRPKRKKGRFCGAEKNPSATDLDDDCVVLEGDPDKPTAVLNDTLSESDDFLVVGEKGQIACRDYPHARSLCIKFPFSATPHERHCNLCHCYVCDSPAPCLNWDKGFSMDHCHATEKKDIWKQLRREFKGSEKRLPKFVPHFTPQSNLIPDAETEILGKTRTVIGVETTLIDSATSRIRTQGRGGGNLSHLLVSSLPTIKRPEFNERGSLSKYVSGNILAATHARNSPCLKKHVPVSSSLRSWNPVNGQDHRTNMDSGSGAYQCASFTDVVNPLRDEGLHQPPADGQPYLQPYNGENGYMHRNQIQTVVDSNFMEFLSWQNEASSAVGQSWFNDPHVQSAVSTSEPSTAAGYNPEFPSLFTPSECSAVMEHGDESLSRPNPSVFPAQHPMELHSWFDPTYNLSSEASIPSAIDPGIPLFGYESSLEWPK